MPRASGLIGYIRSIFGEAKFTDGVSTRRHRPDYLILLFMGLLMLVGLIVIYAIGPQRANVLNNAYGSSYGDAYFFIKQLASLGVALVAFFALAFVRYDNFVKRAAGILLLSLGACVLLSASDLLNIGIAQESLGATRWFDFGPLGSFQPSELLKFAILIFVAVFLGNKIRQGKLNDVKDTLLPLAIITAVSLFLVVFLQKDLGTGISLASIIVVMLVVGGINKRNSIIALSLLAIGGIFLIISAPHRLERIATYFKGDDITAGDENSYHIQQAKIAVGTGGLFGVGIGNSVQATGYLPEAINDSVFAIIGETFGFVGMLTILALFSALLMRLIKLIDHLADVRLKLLAAGVFGWFGSHVILNIASMIGIVPLTGITLPLLSFGGSSMLFMAAALGLAFQLSHYTDHSSNLKENQYENFGSRRGIGRSRHSSRGSITRN